MSKKHVKLKLIFGSAAILLGVLCFFNVIDIAKLTVYIPGYGDVYRFNIYVFDANTNLPVAGAEVRFYSNILGGYEYELTDDRGYVNMLCSVRYTFDHWTVTKDGYQTFVSYNMPIEVDYGNNYIYLQKGQPQPSEWFGLNQMVGLVLIALGTVIALIL